jgi:hypothetical protein
MSAKEPVGKGHAGLVRSKHRASDPPMLGRKSVLMGMLTSGFVIANAAQPSATAAGTVKPGAIAATTPTYLTKWAPSQAYVRGQQVVSTNNDVVSANVAHTSGSTFNAANWSVSSTYAPRPGTGKNPLTGWFHADGYGLSAAGTAAANTAALVAAEAAMSNGDVLYIPAGQYAFTSFAPSKVIKIMGAAASIDYQLGYADSGWTYQPYVTGTVLRSTATTGAAITFAPDMNKCGAAIENIVLIGPGTGTSVGLTLGGSGVGFPVRTRLYNVNIANFSTGILASCENATWDGVYIEGCQTGLYTVYPFNGNTINGINVEYCSAYAIRLTESYNNVFNGGVIQGNTAPTTVSIEATTHSTEQNSFRGIYFENTGAGSTYDDLSVGVASTGTCEGNSFTECRTPATTNARLRFGPHAIGNRLTPGIPTAPILLDSGSAGNVLTLPTTATGTVTDNGKNTVTGAAWRPYTPVWGGTTAPAIGNGTIVGAYYRDGRNCRYRITITMGSTTTYGTGAYTLTLPFTPVGTYSTNSVVGNGTITNGWLRQVVALFSWANKIGLFLSVNESYVSATSPAAWASGMVICIEGAYETAQD